MRKGFGGAGCRRDGSRLESGRTEGEIQGGLAAGAQLG